MILSDIILIRTCCCFLQQVLVLWECLSANFDGNDFGIGILSLKQIYLQIPKGIRRYFDASILIGLFENLSHTNTFSKSNIIRIHLHPYRMFWILRDSPTVENMPPARFFNGLSSPRLEHKNTGHPVRGDRYFGARDGTRTHTAKPHAPQTCLSTIPTLSQVTCIL